MQTQKTMIADALRIVRQDLDLSIDMVRAALRRNQQIEKRAATYLRLLKMAHEYRNDGLELGHADAGLFRQTEPLPFRTGFVGHTPEQVKALEWKMI